MVKVFQYGLLRPIGGAELVDQQMRAAHRYRNTLVEIERGRRSAVRAVQSTIGNIGALEKAAHDANLALDEALKAVRAKRAKTRTRSEGPEHKQRVKDARETRRATLAALREARVTLRSDAQLVLAREAIEMRASELRKNARAHCDVHWGTYLLIEDADQAARKAPYYDGAEPNDPRFARWMSEGQVGVQLQGGMPVAETFGDEDTRLRIARAGAPAPRADGTPRRAGSKDHRELWLRIGSDDDRAPVWARWPMILHRPMPPGSVLKRAVVSLRRIGPREAWTVQFTIEIPEAEPTCGKGAVAIDLGWRLVPEGLRVAYWHGEDGRSGQLALEPAILSALRKPEELRAVRDKNFDVARAVLARWLALQSELPEWLSVGTAHLAQWRSAGRLAALAKRWRDQRFPGDEQAFDALESWRYKDFHLWEWETSQRSKALRRRREAYRVFGARLAAEYGTLVLEKFDLRAVAKHEPTDSDVREIGGARSNRALAATSELRLVARNAFIGRGGVVDIENAVDSTMTCHVCGLIEKFDALNNIHHGCTGCGAVWDQDDNAAQILLGRRIERLRAEKDAGGARGAENPTEVEAVAESRWVRAKRMGAEKKSRR